VLTLVLAERWSRRGARYTHVGSRSRPITTKRLSGAAAAAALAACTLPPLFGFVLPGVQLLAWTLRSWRETIDERFLELVTNSVALAAGAALLALLLALIFAYTQRLRPGRLVRAATRIAAMGYAVPGTVIAVGVMLPFAWLDNTIDGWMRDAFGVSTGLLLSGTVFAVMFAYMVRFLAVSLQTVESGIGRITQAMDEAGRSLGHRTHEVVLRVHAPMLRGSLLTAALLVFVDVMKELPATLILRPFGFNTLAVRAYELASDERLAEASTAALAIVAAGLVPVLVLSISIARSRRRSPALPVQAPTVLMRAIPEGA
jgi:iron(III) transport system permease protein